MSNKSLNTKANTVAIKKGKFYIDIISQVISEILEENHINSKSKPLKAKVSATEEVDAFAGTKIPAISIYNFLERLLKYTMMEDSTLVLVLIYLDRICANSNHKLTYINVHRMILASTVIAIKYNEDNYYNNTFYAKVGGVELLKLRQLEDVFIQKIGYSLYVDNHLFAKYQNYLSEYNEIN
jgi:hypothetical protein